MQLLLKVHPFIFYHILLLLHFIINIMSKIIYKEQNKESNTHSWEAVMKCWYKLCVWVQIFTSFIICLCMFKVNGFPCVDVLSEMLVTFYNSQNSFLSQAVCQVQVLTHPTGFISIFFHLITLTWASLWNRRKTSFWHLYHFLSHTLSFKSIKILTVTIKCWLFLYTPT